MAEATYKSAGVDLQLYQQAMQKLPGLLARTHGPRVMQLAGGFAGLFRLNDEVHRFRDPVLVSGADGVGTKIKVATTAGVHDTIGIDLVAMCVNDCLCLGAEPLFFLDYLALGQDNPQLVGELVVGISEGCLQAKMALLGGETAIMPGLYAAGDFDMAGFCVGVVERDKIIDGKAIQAGDLVLGVASTGFHSNGYSLIRKVVFDTAGLGINDHVPELDATVGSVLLRPTRIYTDVLESLLRRHPARTAIHGLCHITGGGLCENIERVLPDDCQVTIKAGTWTIPPEFAWLDELGSIGDDEMSRVFNMGIGFVLIVSPEAAADVQRQLVDDRQIDSWIIGDVAEGPRQVIVSR